MQQVEDRLALEDFWIAQAEWSRATFGSDEVRGPKGPLKHLQKEVVEALETMDRKYLDLTHLQEEIVDCLFLVFDAARRSGMTHSRFVEKAFEKLEINKKRKWAISPKADEPSEHVRS